MALIPQSDSLLAVCETNLTRSDMIYICIYIYIYKSLSNFLLILYFIFADKSLIFIIFRKIKFIFYYFVIINNL